jgi:hypothetical protein
MGVAVVQAWGYALALEVNDIRAIAFKRHDLPIRPYGPDETVSDRYGRRIWLAWIKRGDLAIEQDGVGHG